MLALFVKVPTMQRLRKIRSFFADSKYSSHHGPLPHISVGHVCKQTTVNVTAETRFVIVKIYRKKSIQGHSNCHAFCSKCEKTIRH